VAAECPEVCWEMRATPFDEMRECQDHEAAGTVGCTSDTGGSGEVACVRRLVDGALFVVGSASSFWGSSGWGMCDAETSERVLRAPSCE